jgi:hypothetical protein
MARRNTSLVPKGVCCAHAGNKICALFLDAIAVPRKVVSATGMVQERQHPDAVQWMQNFAQRKGGPCYSHGGKADKPICSFPLCCTPMKKAGKCYRHGEAFICKRYRDILKTHCTVHRTIYRYHLY